MAALIRSVPHVPRAAASRGTAEQRRGQRARALVAAGRYGSFRARRNAIVLQYHLVYCDTLLLRVAASVLSFASFREGIKTGDGSVVASRMPLYFLTVAFGGRLPRPLVTIGAPSCWRA